MKWSKKTTAVSLATVMAASLSVAGGSAAVFADDDLNYADIKLGEDYTDVEAELKLLTNRTDMLDADYTGKNWDAYLK